jgi:hypothetical protein
MKYNAAIVVLVEGQSTDHHWALHHSIVPDVCDFKMYPLWTQVLWTFERELAVTILDRFQPPASVCQQK